MKIWKWLVRGWNIAILLFVVLPIVVGFGEVMISNYLASRWDILVDEQSSMFDKMDTLDARETTTLAETLQWYSEWEDLLHLYLAHLDKMDYFLDRYGSWFSLIDGIDKNKQILEDEREDTLEMLTFLDKPL